MTTIETAPTFATMRDFLRSAVPGDVFTDPNPAKRSEHTYRFMKRLTSEDHVQCGPRDAGGLVETITTTHNGKAECSTNQPEYAYWSYVTSGPLFADDVCIKVVIEVGGNLSTLDVTPAKRMSRPRLREYHQRAVDAFLNR